MFVVMLLQAKHNLTHGHCKATWASPLTGPIESETFISEGDGRDEHRNLAIGKDITEDRRIPVLRLS